MAVVRPSFGRMSKPQDSKVPSSDHTAKMSQRVAFRISVNVLIILAGCALTFGVYAIRTSPLFDLFSPLSLAGILAVVVGVLRVFSIRSGERLSAAQVFLGLGIFLTIVTIFGAKTNSSEISGLSFAGYLVGLSAFAWAIGAIKRSIRRRTSDYTLKTLRGRLSSGEVSIVDKRGLMAELEKGR